MSLVSVIIPYYKKIHHINETLNSVLNQTFQNFEIILIYDDINDDDLKIINSKFKENPKIKIIKNLKNLGAGLSRNIGIKNSSSEFIAFLDADDFWHHKKLEKQIKFMRENNYDFTFCNYIKRFNSKELLVKSDKKKLEFHDLLLDCKIGLSTVILKKK